MIYYNNEARETAKLHIKKLYVKFATMKPSETFDRDDIRETMYYLKTLDDAIGHEIFQEKIKKLRERG